MEPATPVVRPRPAFGIVAWFVWVTLLLVITGLLLPQIIAFVDFSERAPFSLVGILMMAELAVVFFGLTLVLQHKRAGFGFAIGISLLPVPILAGLIPLLLAMPPAAAAGWTTLMVPIGLAISGLLLITLTRRASRAWFTED
ncbi:MAG TPA: hypothetical protein VIC63_07055 [Candidatus Limnocylindria bacterium]